MTPRHALSFSVLGPAFLVATALVAMQETPAHWSYKAPEGPAQWASLSPDYETCGIGKDQSPIDIRDPKASDLPAIRFHYQRSPLTIIDNGHTIQINYQPGSTISVGDAKYELQQFHFHHPSEEQIDGKLHAMVAHLVHKNKDGKLAVIAVLLEPGAENELVRSLWEHLPPAKEKEVTFDDVTIDATNLLPQDRTYYTFVGSLTTPPCTEGVTWFVLKNPMTLSNAQIEQFARIYPLNARPVQPLNGRLVQASR
jgi:carbonic anhydrase